MPRYGNIIRLSIIFLLLPVFVIRGDSGNPVNGSVKKFESDFDKTVKAYRDSIDAAHRNKQYEKEADLYLQLGKLHLKVSDYTETFSCLFKSLELRQQVRTDSDVMLGYTYAIIGEAYRAITQFDNSLEYLNKSLEIYNRINDLKGAAYVRNRLASVYYEIAVNRNDTTLMKTAETETNYSLTLSDKTGQKELTVSNYNILGAIYNFFGFTAEGRRYLLKALTVSDSLPGYLDSPNILNNIANSYLIDKNYDKAIEYAGRSFNAADSTGIKIYKIISLRIITESYSGKGDFRNAYEYLLKYNSENGAVFNEKMESDVQNVKKKYDNELENQIGASEKNRNTILITAITLFLLIIGLGLLLRMRGIQKINRDLEAQRDTIIKQKEDLEKINETKNKFFSILSHDLRNPLSGVNGFSNMLNSGYDSFTDEEKKEYIGYIKSSSESMYRIIDKVLTWSRLQSHTIKVHREPFDLNAGVNNIINLQRPNASKKGILLENKTESDTVINSDKSIIDTVITNLIDNSVKFTPEGGRITVGTENRNETTVIYVQDTGVGISEDAIKELFSKHSISTTRGTNNEKGTGFGLTICIEMLELIGTKLQIESKVGEGSRFFFKIDSGTKQYNLF